MVKKLKISRELEQSDLRKEELDWLKKCVTRELSEGISEKKIIFSSQGVYLTCKVSTDLKKDVPTRFLEYNLVEESISGKESVKGLFVRLKLLYWYIYRINDIWGYKKLMDSLFYEAFYGENVDYDKSKKGYRLLDIHLKKVLKGWKPIKKTVFIGYLQFLRLLKDSTVLPLGTINEELKKGKVIQLGLTKASKKSFGKVAHRQLLGVCWKCGDDDVLPNGLCSDCDDYWDAKTK